MISSSSVKKTGHKDIDALLVKAHSLIQDGEILQSEIRKSLAYKPKPLRRTRGIYIASADGKIKGLTKD